MRTTRCWRPGVEALEERTVLSAGHYLPLAAVAPVVHHGHHHHKHPSHRTGNPGQTGPGTTQQLLLAGQVSGTWTKQFTNPDVGSSQVLMGNGTVAPLGAVQMSGELHTPGFIARGKTTGTVTLMNADGSVTLRLVGPQQPGFSQPPPTFQYTITGGTGKYAGASGNGTATFAEQPPSPLVCPPNAMCAPILGAGTFTMTFTPAPTPATL